MTAHQFTKTCSDHASGALVLLRSRIREYRAQHGLPPAQLLLHVPTARRVFAEFADAHGHESYAVWMPWQFDQAMRAQGLIR